MDLNLFDALAVVLLAFAVLAGIRTGALPQVGGIGGAIAGIAVMLAVAPWLLEVTADVEPVPRALMVLGAILGAVLLGETIGSTLGRSVAERLGHGRALGHGPVRGRPAGRRAGAADHLARGRPARREPVPAPAPRRPRRP